MSSMPNRLSPQQRRIWLLHEHGDPAALVARSSVEIRGDLRTEPMVAAVNAVAARHEILRTTFRSDSTGLASPTVHEALPPEAHFDTGDNRLLRGTESWRLEIGPLWKVEFSMLRQGVYRMDQILPALCADGPSLDRLAGDVLDAYFPSDRRLESGGIVATPYSGVADWALELLESDDVTGEKRFWRDVAESAAPVGLPYALAEGSGFRTSTASTTLSGSTADAVRDLAQQLKVSPEIILLAGWIGVVHRLTANSFLTVAVAMDGRTVDELKDVVGPLARHLPMNVDVAGADFADLVSRVAATRELLANRQELYDPSEHAGAKQWLPLAFELEPPYPAYSKGPLEATLTERSAVYERFQVKAVWREQGDSWVCRINHDESRIRQAVTERLAAQYVEFVRSACAAPRTLLDAVSMIDGSERRRLIVDFNAKRYELPARTCVHDLFRRQATEHPDSDAVTAADGTLSYAELDRLSDRCASRLRSLTAGEPVVGILLERSIMFVVAMLGVLKSGGSYLPLDPGLPVRRMEDMLRAAGSVALLTSRELDGKLKVEGAPTFLIEDLVAAGTEPVASSHPIRPDNLAYVVFTSGSTGAPKGVGVSHRALLNYVLGVRDALSLPRAARFAAVSSFSTDLAHTAIFPTLCSGGSLHVIATEAATDPERLAVLMEEGPIDCLKIVPSHLTALLESLEDPARILPRLLLVMGGEQVDAPLIRRIQELAPGCRVFNHYGPSETTVGVATRPFHPAETEFPGGIAPFGRPLPNAMLVVLDRDMRPVPTGGLGELYIGGPSLARGYLG